MSLLSTSQTAICESVSLVLHQPHADKLQQIENCEHVPQEDETKFNKDWLKEIIIPDKYNGHSDDFLHLLSEFEKLWDANHGRIRTERHQIQLAFSDIGPDDNAPYHASLTARHFAAMQIQKLVQEDVIQAGNTEWASPMVFVSNIWLMEVQRLLPQAQRGNSEGFISPVKDGPMTWLHWRGQIFLNSRWQFLILADSDWPTRKIKNGVHESPRSLPIQSNAILPEKGTGYIPAGDRRVISKNAVSVLVPRRYCGLLVDWQHAHYALATKIDTAFGIQESLEQCRNASSSQRKLIISGMLYCRGDWTYPSLKLQTW